MMGLVRSLEAAVHWLMVQVCLASLEAGRIDESWLNSSYSALSC